MSGVSDLKAILRIRPFRRLWAVLGLSAAGDWLGLLASSLFAAAQFESTTAKGAAFSSVIIVRLAPSLILGPLAGVFADRWDRRITMAVCDFLRFSLFLSMPLVALGVGTGLKAAGWIVIAQFLTEVVGMMWTPAKEASVPNLLPKSRLEAANQLTLITTYGLTPVLAAALMSILESPILALPSGSWAAPAAIGLYINALTFLASAAVVFFGIPEISERKIDPGEAALAQHGGMVKDFLDGWRYVNRNTTVRGLVLGMMGAFAGAGIVIGTGQFYAKSLGGGDATFTLLFATIFVGIGIGVALGPIIVKDFSRQRLFGMAITLAGAGLTINAIAPHASIALLGTLIVGSGAGMAFLAGITLLGREVSDTVRGRIFAFIWTGARVVLMISIAAAGLIGGFGSARTFSFWVFSIDLSFSRILLLLGGVLAAAVGIAAFRQMDDKPGVPVFADLISSIQGRPLMPGKPADRGLFIAFEGGEGSGKSTQAVKLAAWLRLHGHETVLTREPGATELGRRIRTLVLDPAAGTAPSARAEALLYAADRAQHVSQVVRPALDDGKVVISDRYSDSSLAYQGSGRQLPTEEISWLSSWATDNLKPDVVILLDIDPKTGLKRATEKGADRLEAESLDFHEKVRLKFRDLADKDSARYIVLDATDTPEEIAKQVAERIGEILPDGKTDSGWPRYGDKDGHPSIHTAEQAIDVVAESAPTSAEPASTDSAQPHHERKDDLVVGETPDATTVDNIDTAASEPSRADGPEEKQLEPTTPISQKPLIDAHPNNNVSPQPAKPINGDTTINNQHPKNVDAPATTIMPKIDDPDATTLMPKIDRTQLTGSVEGTEFDTDDDDDDDDKPVRFQTGRATP